MQSGWELQHSVFGMRCYKAVGVYLQCQGQHQAQRSPTYSHIAVQRFSEPHVSHTDYCGPSLRRCRFHGLHRRAQCYIRICRRTWIHDEATGATAQKGHGRRKRMPASTPQKPAETSEDLPLCCCPRGSRLQGCQPHLWVL